MDNILSLLKWYQQIVWLHAKQIDILALAHKIVHTFEKMDAINPTFDVISMVRQTELDNIHVFLNFKDLFGLVPFV